MVRHDRHDRHDSYLDKYAKLYNHQKPVFHPKILEQSIFKGYLINNFLNLYEALTSFNL